MATFMNTMARWRSKSAKGKAELLVLWTDFFNHHESV